MAKGNVPVESSAKCYQVLDMFQNLLQDVVIYLRKFVGKTVDNRNLV